MSDAPAIQVIEPPAGWPQPDLRELWRYSDLVYYLARRDLAIRYEDNSNRALWRQLRGAAHRVGTLGVFPHGDQGSVSDDHVPFLERGVPSIDLIDFDFPCWHRRCDDMSAVSQRSVNAVGETIYELLRTL